MKILDCTLRDGGYYTNWDFPKKTVEKYLQALSQLPIDYVELGYRTPLQKNYLGEFCYTPLQTLSWAKQLLGDKKIALMIDEKNVTPSDVSPLLKDCSPYVDLLRITVDPNNEKKIRSAITLAKEVRNLGFQVAFNLMYLSKISDNSPIYTILEEVESWINFLYLVDSYGSVYPDQLQKYIQTFSSRTSLPLGFHGHNNLEMAFTNTLTAINNGISIVDSTIMGMGRGAGNTKTELLLSYMHSQSHKNIDLNTLGELLADWNHLYQQYQWGTSFPYMISGANSLPQKDVMAWMSKRRYSIQAIIQGLKHLCEDSVETYPLLSTKSTKLTQPQALLIGGGDSLIKHRETFEAYLNDHPSLPIIHLSSRHLPLFHSVPNPQILCLTGTEGQKLNRRLHGKVLENIQAYVLPPSPRNMGAYIPQSIADLTTELPSSSISPAYQNAPQAIACEVALQLNIKQLLLIGCDGYEEKDYELTQENQTILDFYQTQGLEIISLLPTRYSNIPVHSLHGLLAHNLSAKEEALI